MLIGSDEVAPVSDQLEPAATVRAAGADVDAVVSDGAPHPSGLGFVASREGFERDLRG